MSRIVVIGGTGYAGSHITREAVSRGHEVTVIARRTPETPIGGARYVQGSVLDLDGLGGVFDGADAVISALSPRGDMENEVIGALRGLTAKLAGTSTRLGVVGGAGGSLVAPGGPRLFDQGFPRSTGMRRRSASTRSSCFRMPTASNGSSSTRPRSSGPGPRASAPAGTTTAAMCWFAMPTGTPPSPARTSRSPSSTRSSSRSTATVASPSATAARRGRASRSRRCRPTPRPIR